MGAISFYSCYQYKALINPTNPASSWSPESFGRNRDFDRLDAFLLTEKGHCDGKSSESTAFFSLKTCMEKAAFSQVEAYMLSVWGLEGFTSIFQPMSCFQPNPDIKGEVFWSLKWYSKKNQVIALAGIWKGLLLFFFFFFLLLLLWLLWLRLFEEGFSSAYPAYPCQAWTFVHASHFLAPRHTEKEFRCKLSDHHGGFGMQKTYRVFGSLLVVTWWLKGKFCKRIFWLGLFHGEILCWEAIPLCRILRHWFQALISYGMVFNEATK